MTDVKNGQEKWHIRTLTYRLADAGMVVLGWWFAAKASFSEVSTQHALLTTVAIVLFHFIGEITGMYRNWRGVDMGKEIMCTVLTWLITVPLIICAMTVFRLTSVAMPFLQTWLFVTLACMALCRVSLRLVQVFLRSRGYNLRGYAIVGINELALRLARKIEDAPEMGLQLVGFYDDRDAERTGEIDARIGHRVGNLDALVDQARRGSVSMIYLTFPMRAEQRIRHVLERLADSTASVYIVPDFFVFELLHSRWTDIGGLPTVSVFENPFYGVDGVVKRLLDIALASLLLFVLAVPMAIIAFLVKCSSPGPVFFRQRRYGLDGREILVWKFRSMTVCEDGEQVLQATQGDPRTTRIGALLRKTSLDELPQLFNVLHGTMSLVGPRPHASAHNEEFRAQIPGYMLRHKVRPGMTGLAQVNGFRGETDTLEKMERRVECDHQYIREWSLLMDIKILFRTLWVVWTNKNAH